MKQFIKEQLHIFLENNARFATKRDYYTTLFKVTKVHQLYGGDPYFENLEEGQWIGNAICDIHGRVKITTNLANARDTTNNRLGMVSEKPMYLQFTLRAGRGIEHPDTFTPNTQPARTRDGLNGDVEPPEQTQQFTLQLPDGVTLENGETSITFGVPKIGSPASDAAIKTYLIFGKEILSFVEKNMKNRIGYLDGKGKQLAQNTNDKDKYKFDKLEQEKQRAANKRAAQLKNLEANPEPEIPQREPKISDYEERKKQARLNRQG